MRSRPHASTVLRIEPITKVGSEVDICANAMWIGQVEEGDLAGIAELVLVGGERFSRARLLIWNGDQPRGFAELPVSSGTIDAAELVTVVAKWPPVVPPDTGPELPSISVVVCTRDRPDHLRDALANLVDLDYPDFEVLVVDNNPAGGLTASVVDSFEAASDVTVRLVSAPGQGLSIARNVALQHAIHEIVAFTDDDVVVDSRWLRNIAHGFGRRERVVCVCGIVPSAELATPAQLYFDRRVGWARRCEAAVYQLAEPPHDDPLFPMRVAEFGTGANFAVRRDVLIELGGFDEGLGIGSPTGGGEDIDMFVRVLLAGHVLVREPSAVVWHRHRRTIAELEAQVTNYGLGLGAWIAKLGTRPRTFGMALKRVRPAIKHLRRVTVVEHEQNGPPDAALEALYGRELRGVLRGPLALFTARLAGRTATPLSCAPSKLIGTFDFRRNQHWGAPDNSIMAGRLSLAAIVLGLLGALGSVSVLPTPVLAVAVGAFTLFGPGSLLLSWFPKLPPPVLVPLIPAISVAVCILVVSGLLMLGFYNPFVILVSLSALNIAGGLVHCQRLARPQVVIAS